MGCWPPQAPAGRWAAGRANLPQRPWQPVAGRIVYIGCRPTCLRNFDRAVLCCALNSHCPHSRQKREGSCWSVVCDLGTSGCGTHTGACCLPAAMHDAVETQSGLAGGIAHAPLNEGGVLVEQRLGWAVPRWLVLSTRAPRPAHGVVAVGCWVCTGPLHAAQAGHRCAWLTLRMGWLCTAANVDSRHAGSVVVVSVACLRLQVWLVLRCVCAVGARSCAREARPVLIKGHM